MNIQESDILVQLTVANWRGVLLALRGTSGNALAIAEIERSLKSQISQKLEVYKEQIFEELFEDDSDDTQEFISIPKLHPAVLCYEDTNENSVALDEEEAPIVHRATFLKPR